MEGGNTMRHRRCLTALLVLALAWAAPAAAQSKPVWTPERDEEIERFLLEADIIEVVPIGTGVTNPLRLTMRLRDREMTAAFKDVNDEIQGRTTFDSGVPEYNFTDKYIYERAAYLLDRELGINMVPVTVIREVEGKMGAITEWVPGTIDEGERQERQLDSDPRSIRMRQTDVKRMFDALIQNTDRNLGNTLYDLDDWSMYLIDHSRAFRLGKKLEKGFATQMLTLDRDVYGNLQTLEEARLMEVLSDLLSKAQIKSIVKRRDKIVEKVEADRVEYGDPIILHD